ncbi:hypothetical protein [Pseudomonas antarctica]|uniref:hypothetical protein n=1 Tax=Pseudomonas antarctica TaxID=219572 RepID=UPI003F75490D
MTFIEINCPIGQFDSAITAGEYAVDVPPPARSEKLDDLWQLAEMPENSRD